jgi:hypothetical protein
MAERLLNQDCCSQIGGYWTNGVITIIDGTNTYTINDTKGITLAQSFGETNYCSSCPPQLKVFNGEVTNNPTGLLTEICCEDYGFNYGVNDGKCYTCPSYNPANIINDNTNVVIYVPPVTGFGNNSESFYNTDYYVNSNGYMTYTTTSSGPYYQVPELAIILDGQNKDLSETCCQKINQETGLGFYYSLGDDYSLYSDPNGPGYLPNLQPTSTVRRCYQCPGIYGYVNGLDPTKPDLEDWGYTIVSTTDTLTNGFQPDYEILYNNQSITNHDCCVQFNYYIYSLTVSTTFGDVYYYNQNGLPIEKNGKCYIR